MSHPASTKYTVESVGPKIREFLTRTIQNAGLELSFDITSGDDHPYPEVENPAILVKFSGPDVDELLANKAELLLALEVLTMEMLRMAQDEHSLICFDANDARLMRMEELRLSAMAALERVRATHQPFFFSPMNSRERRILHLALRDAKDIRSESTGMGPSRAVVVYPADMPSVPSSATPARSPYPPHGGRRR